MASGAATERNDRYQKKSMSTHVCKGEGLQLQLSSSSKSKTLQRHKKPLDV